MASQTRWVCPQCGEAKMGPQKPRKDNIVRYCLPCSEKAGRLVERSAPTLERRRAKRAEQLKSRRQAKQAREKEKERERASLILYDAAGRQVLVEVEKEVRAMASRSDVTLHRFTWKRRSDGSNTGRAWRWEHRMHLSIGSDSLEKFCMVTAHELAHLAAPIHAKHGDSWRDEYERIAGVLFGVKPIYRGSVSHHRYAINRPIVEQLEATSRGEYRRSQVRLPLIGNEIVDSDESNEQ